MKVDFSNVWAYAFTLEGANFFEGVEASYELRREFIGEGRRKNDREVIVGRREIYEDYEGRQVILRDIDYFKVGELKFLQPTWDLPLLQMMKELYRITLEENETKGDYKCKEFDLIQMSRGYCLDDKVFEVKI